VSQVRTLTPNLTVVTLKSGLQPQNRRNWQTNFWYKFAQKGYTALSDFYNIWLGEGLQGLHPHAKFYRYGFKMWAYSHQNRKNW